MRPIAKPNAGAVDSVSLTKAAAEIAADVELGQADQPITAALRWLGLRDDDAPLRVSVVALDIVSREAVLNWLTGATGSSFSLKDRTLTTIRCNVPTSAVGDRTTGPSLPAVIARRSLLQNVDLTVAATPESITTDDQRLTQFCNLADALVIAWPLVLPLHLEEHLRLLTELLDEFPTVVTVTVGKLNEPPRLALELPSEDAPTKESMAATFLRRVKNHRSVSRRIHLAGDQDKRLSSLFPRLETDLRLGLRSYRYARLLREAIATLNRRVGENIQELDRASDALGKRRKSLSSRRGKASQTFTDLRFNLQKSLNAVENRLLATNAQALQPLGNLSQLMQEIVADLEESNLEVEYDPASVKYSVNAAHFSGINRRVTEKLKSDLQQEVTAVNDEVRRNVSQVESQVIALGAEPTTLRWESLDEDPIWFSIRNLIHIGRDAEIEIPRRGIVDLLTAGRQKVFILIMLVGLAGRMGFSKDVLGPLGLDHISGGLAAGFTLVAVTVFVASMFDAIFRWRKESKDQMTRELQKIKDAVYADGIKIFDQSQKSKLQAVKEYLKETSKILIQQIDDVEEGLNERSRIEAEEAKERLETAAKRLESRRKSLEDSRKRLAVLHVDSAALQSAAEDRLSQTLTNAATMKPEADGDRTEKRPSSRASGQESGASPAQLERKRPVSSTRAQPSIGGRRPPERFANALDESISNHAANDAQLTTPKASSSREERKAQRLKERLARKESRASASKRPPRPPTLVSNEAEIVNQSHEVSAIIPPQDAAPSSGPRQAPTKAKSSSAPPVPLKDRLAQRLEAKKATRSASSASGEKDLASGVNQQEAREPKQTLAQRIAAKKAAAASKAAGAPASGASAPQAAEENPTADPA